MAKINIKLKNQIIITQLITFVSFVHGIIKKTWFKWTIQIFWFPFET
jgi:hypothetical protein